MPATKTVGAYEAKTTLSALLELVEKGHEIVITKQYASSFFGTSLAATLTAAGIDSLVLTGVSTSGCVRATAVDGCQHGFVTVVARDGVGDRRPEPHEANLFDIQAKYGEVLDADAVIDWWRNRGAG